MARSLDAPTDRPQASWICASCGATAAGRYCANCGERGTGTPAGENRAWPDRTHPFLGRLLASLRALASPPGKLTADWIRGRRVGYLPPLSLFLWINVAFFVVQSASGLGVLTWPLKTHLEDDSIAWITTRLFARYGPGTPAPTETYASVFNALEAVHAKSLVIVMVPAFAAALALLLLDRRRAFKASLTFAVHFFSFSLIWLSALFPAVAIAVTALVVGGIHPPSHHTLDLIITSLEVAILAWYLHVALATVFGLSMLRRLATVIVLVFALYFILKAYHVVVFAVTLYST